LFAVIRTGGKQYKVAPGDELNIESLADSEPGRKFALGEVLMVADGENVRVGAPVLDGVTVQATVVSNGRGKKIEVFKYKAKKRYRKGQGHRQNYTRVQIDEILT